MMHARHLLFDEQVGIFGSANLDMRSLYLNYEVSMFMYSKRQIQHTAKWMESIMDQSRETKDTQATHLQRWIEDLGLLVSPLL